MQFSIAKDINGDEFVDVVGTMTNDDLEQIPETLSDIVKSKFSHWINANGQNIGINQKTAKEWRMSRDAQKLFNANETIYTDKLNAFQNADELLKVSKNYVNERAERSRKDHFSKFARGEVRFRVGENGYSADIVVDITKSQAAVLYDIVNIQPEKIIDASNTTTAANITANRRGETSLDPTISQADSGVKLSIRSRNETDTVGGPLPLTLPTAEETMDRRAAQDDDEASFSLVGETADGRRIYETDFADDTSRSEKIREFKNRIASVFNLGAVELKTDTKKIVVHADRFTAQKNIYGDIVLPGAKLNALYDMADILENAEFVPPANPEDSYVDPTQKPKNEAHKGVKYWYKFRTNIVMDGVGYQVTFNIRDKGKQQYAYLIEFKKDETSSASNTAVPGLLRSTEISHLDDTISQHAPGVKPSIPGRNETDTLAGPLPLTLPTAEDIDTGSENARTQDDDEAYSLALGGYTPDVSVSSENIMSYYGIDNLNRKYDVINKVAKNLPYLSTEQQRKPITNLDTGLEIEIWKSGIKETFGNDSYFALRPERYKKAKLAIMPQLAKLIKYGEVRAPERGNYHNPNSSARYAYLAAPANIDGIAYTVTMDIRRSPSGENRFYIHDLQVEAADTSFGLIDNEKNRLTKRISAASAPTISQADSGVKPSIRSRNETDTLAGPLPLTLPTAEDITDLRGADDRALHLPDVEDDDILFSLSDTDADDAYLDDRAYLDAVDADDEALQQRLVQAAAEYAMPESRVRDRDGNLLKVYHGTKSFGFTVFDRSRTDYEGPFYFTSDLDTAGPIPA